MHRYALSNKQIKFTNKIQGHFEGFTQKKGIILYLRIYHIQI
jgi:hypothetical protein